VLDLGHFGVPIFFVLSGFVIALSLDGKPMSLEIIGRFILRRSIRLDLPYWTAIVLLANVFGGSHSATTDALWWAASIAACLLAAAVVWLLVERPAMALAHRLSLVPHSFVEGSSPLDS
jgi:peptidoglycan/LPS O-acetylase OafA/YrhL